jgi:hypothetical protein
MANTQKHINEICKARCIPAIKKNMRCVVDGKAGKVIGGNSSLNLQVLFDGWKSSSNCHPYWRITVFNDDGSVFYKSKN